MATMNPFDLLGDDDNEDPTLLLAAAQLKVVDKPKKPDLPEKQPPPAKSAKLPTKPPPPAQAVRDAKYEGGRGAGRGGGGGGRGPGFGRGRGGGFNRDRDISNDETSFGNNNGFGGGYRPSEEGDGKPSERRAYNGPPRGGGGGGGAGGGGGFRGPRRGGYSNGEDRDGERPRRAFDRRSGTGRGSDIKRDGSGRGNWGTPSDDIAPETEEPVAEIEKNIVPEKQAGEEELTDANKENPSTEPEEKEPEEDKEMTLEEYEKIREEKRKALLSTKAEERKIDVKKEFGAMQQLSNKKKGSDEIFIKLGSEKDKKKDVADKDDKAKKSVSINEFLKPAEGERYFNPGGRGRGRDRQSRGGYGGGGGGGRFTRDPAAPSIEDPGHFPILGGK
ncbi:RGG repeats nuclear RNA binding protein A [Euphorbia peplus]|nr:RGG repeats nuclear RNA binding protein A [Euphorbia peplus]